MRQPVIRALSAAPEDDEPLTEEERLDLERARAGIVAGETVSHSEVKAQRILERIEAFAEKRVGDVRKLRGGTGE